MKKFSPNMFLMALGSGGIAVSGFAFLNYTVPHGGGLITYAMLHSKTLSLAEKLLYGFTEGYMIVFTIIHLLVTFFLLKKYFAWKKEAEYFQILNDPLLNSSLLVPFVSIFMTFNVVLGVVRYFFPILSDNLQALMLPGLIAWGILWLFLMILETKILIVAFTTKFDLSKISFSWLMQPFTLGMATVTGTGIAAMATDATVAHLAAFISLVSFTMAIFLLFFKLFFLFGKSLSEEKLPDNQFLPSFLMIVPILTVLGISAFRYGHYLERQFDFHLGAYFLIVTLITFAFQTWYLFFGLGLIKNYLFREMPGEYHVSQWGLICPFVAYAVMGSFVFANFVPSLILLVFISLITFFFVIFYLYLFLKQLICRGLDTGDDKVYCAGRGISAKIK
ncbi:MAG: hypothetical protein EOM84_01575 [Sphingobacteriia bacterium]|nr:hypothetical protein [Sphingobacteriia bacterium]